MASVLDCQLKGRGFKPLQGINLCPDFYFTLHLRPCELSSNEYIDCTQSVESWDGEEEGWPSYAEEMKNESLTLGYCSCEIQLKGLIFLISYKLWNNCNHIEYCQSYCTAFSTGIYRAIETLIKGVQELSETFNDKRYVRALNKLMKQSVRANKTVKGQQA